MSTLKELRKALAELTALMPALEAHLAPVLEQPMREYVQPLEPLDQAKCHVTLSFALYTALFVYLKACGMDTAQPQVRAQLDRLKTYFTKLQAAEAWTQRSTVDKQAAQRFVKAALGPASGRSSLETREQPPSRSQEARRST